MSGIIPLSVPNLCGNELKYVSDAIAEEWVSTAGKYVSAFEEQFAAYAKTKNAVSCQSGTAALHLALIECGVSWGDLVIVPTLTFIAAVNPCRYVGADPVFMDCDDSLCIDITKLSRYLEQECERRNGVLYDRLQNRPIKAIVVVHVFGNGADMEGLMRVAKAYDLPIVEDATEAVGTFYMSGKYAGRMAGTIGDIGAYSFNGNKIITTGGGGMIVARDAAKLAHIKHLSTQAKSNDLYYLHDEVGFNYRMTNLQASVGVAQLEQLEQFIKTKKTNYHHYTGCGITLLSFGESVRPNYWFYSYQTNHRDELIQHLARQKIQTRPIWGLCHNQPMYRNCRAYEIEAANAYYDTVINIPCSSNLTKEDIERVVDALRTFNKGSIGK